MSSKAEMKGYFQAQTLDRYIKAHYGGNRSEFARIFGCSRTYPKKMIDAGAMVINGRVYTSSRPLEAVKNGC